MATAKKKTSAKRTVKYAAKTQARAAQATSHATQSATHAGSQWAQRGVSEWQKGAKEWAKHSAKLYQLPFAQTDAGDAAKTAAATVQSATENMMKAGSDMMEQFFGQAPKAFSAEAFNPTAAFKNFDPSAAFKGFDASKAQEKLTQFARESAEQLSKSTGGANRAVQEFNELSRENVQALVEVTNTAVSVSKELSAEIVSYTNKVFSQNVEMSKQVLTCRTLNDMFDLSTRIVKSNLDAFFSESVKLSEKLFQCASDVSEPLNERLSETSERLTKAISA